MSFKSQAQRKFMYSKHPEIAKRLEKETPNGKLPKHVKKSKKSIKKHFELVTGRKKVKALV